MANMLLLSEKFKNFLRVDAEREFLEGTTAAGKTTVGIFKFMLKVAGSDKKYHVLAGTDKGTVEKNVINSERGLIEQFDGVARYYAAGKGGIGLPHIEYDTVNGTKIIYVTGFENKSRWKKVLGSQSGCVYIDEVNTADMEFLREISHRCDYMMTTSNPDSPDLDVYKEFINKSRPLKRYVADYPDELLEQLDSPREKGWVHWYFTFYDNAAMTAEDIEKKIRAVPKGTKMYKNKILGLRGKATGLVFANFDERKHIKSKQWAKQFIRTKKDQWEYFIKFSCGVDTSYSQKSPDTIAMAFIGITNKGKLIVLDERVYNNAELSIPLAPSDTARNIVDFMKRNTEEWGMCHHIFLDSADQATKTEYQKYKRSHSDCVYNINDAYKKVTRINRINLQLGWLAETDNMTENGEVEQIPNMYILNHCKEYVKELNKYSWDEEKDNEPEDGNDHMVNAVQYAFLPYKEKIGVTRK